MRLAARHVLARADGAKMIEEARPPQMMFGDPAEGRCRNRHRQIACRKIADQFRRTGFHRDSGFEEQPHLHLTILEQPRDREIGAEPLPEDGVNFRLGGSDHGTAEFFRKIVAQARSACDHRTAIDGFGVEQQPVHVEDHGLDGKWEGGHRGSGDLHRWVRWGHIVKQQQRIRALGQGLFDALL